MGYSVPEAFLGPVALSDDRTTFLFVALVAALAWIAAARLTGSRTGRAMRAARDSEPAAAALGIDVGRSKLLAFSISAAFAGLAGGLFALVTGFVSPGTFSFTMSLTFLAMVVLGGLDSTHGAVVGSLVMGYLSLEMDTLGELPLLGPALEAFTDLGMAADGLPFAGWVFTGAVILCTLLVEPRGLYGLWSRWSMSRDADPRLAPDAGRTPT